MNHAVSSEIASPTAPAEAKKEEAAAASAPTLPEVPPGELKMVLVARTDLKMQPGMYQAVSVPPDRCEALAARDRTPLV